MIIINAKYNINQIKGLCAEQSIDYQDRMIKSYRVRLQTESNSVEEKSIKVISIPLESAKEEEILEYYGITRNEINSLYMAYAKRVQKTRAHLETLKNSDTFPLISKHILFDDEVLDDPISKSSHVIYKVRQPVSAVNHSVYFCENTTSLSAILRIIRSTIEAAKILSEHGLHFGAVNLSNIVVNSYGEILFDSNLFTDLEEEISEDERFLFPKTIHESIFYDKTFTLEKDIYAVSSMAWNLLSGLNGDAKPDFTKEPGYASKEVVTLLKKGLSLQYDDSIIAEYSKQIEFIENDESLDKEIQIGHPLQREPAIHIDNTSSEPVKIAETEEAPHKSTALNDGLSGQKPAAADATSDQEEAPDPEVAAEKVSPIAKLKGKIGGLKKKQAEEAQSTEDKNIAAELPSTQEIPEGAEVKGQYIKKDSEDGKKKFSLESLKSSKVILPAAACFLVIVLVVGNLWGTPSSLQEPTSSSQDSGSSSSSSGQRIVNGTSHYSSIDSENENDNDSVPSSSTYSGDDEDDTSSSSSSDSNSSSSSSTSSSSSSGSSSSSNSASSSSSSTSSSTSGNRVVSSNITSSNTSGTRNPTSSSVSSNTSSSTSSGTQSFSTQSSQTTTSSQPVVKPTTTLTVTPATATMKAGDAVDITPTMSCLFTSDKSAVAIVDNGKIIAKSAGTCTITAQGLDGQTFNISVTVT